MADETDGSFYNGSGYDPAAVRFFDTAHEGARVRAVASLVADGGLESLAGAAPRSIVVVTGDRMCAVAANLVAAVHTPATVPVVVTGRLPSYVGALDVVVGCCDHDDPAVSAAVRDAADRAAAVVVLAPADSGVLADAPGRAITVPAPPTTGDVTVARVAATVEAVVCAAGSDHALLAARLGEAADRIDGEIAVLAPDRDPVVNPAARLADHVAGAAVIHTATTPLGLAVAEAAACHLAAAGRIGCVLDRNAAAVAAERHREMLAVADDDGEAIFHDPFIDGPPQPTAPPVKIVVWGEPTRGLPDSLACQIGDRPVTGFAGAVALTVHAWAAAVR